VKLNCAAEHNPSQRLTASSFKLLSSQPVRIPNWLLKEPAIRKKPRLCYLIGTQAKVATRLQRFLPEAAYEWGKRSTFKLDK
jgi:hypothetical protein